VINEVVDNPTSPFGGFKMSGFGTKRGTADQAEHAA
jgi:acyl-CoA reductase-like NAD-dependent aldehyde dehydrogenase